MESVYPPNSDQEFSFEELRAMSRGWSTVDWRQQKQCSAATTRSPLKSANGNTPPSSTAQPSATKSPDPEGIENLSQSFQQQIDLNNSSCGNLSVHDVSTQSMVGMPHSQPQSQAHPSTQKQKEKKYKVREVKQETQTVKTRLESPTGKKIKRKNSNVEPTMTFHSKAATNDIYDMFNQPLRKPEVARDDTQSGEETDFTEEVDDGYSTTGDGESTGTGRVSAPSSEFGDGDDTLSSHRHDLTESQTQSGSQSDSLSPWSDFTASKHVPRLVSSTKAPSKVSRKGQRRTRLERKQKHSEAEDVTESMDSSSRDATQSPGFDGGFDTQAIAAIADGNFEDMDTKAIAMIAGDVDDDDCSESEAQVTGVVESEGAGAVQDEAEEEQQQQTTHNDNNNDRLTQEDLATPVDDVFSEHREIPHKPLFVPIPPEDYEPTPMRPFRDPALLAQNKLPFMTPIVERTESSVAPSTIFNDPDYFSSKTPSRSTKEKYDSPSRLKLDELLMSSPQHGTPTSSAKRKLALAGAKEEEVLTSSPRQKKVLANLRSAELTSPVIKSPARAVLQPTTRQKGPIVADLQCNPCDDAIRQQILTAVHPPLSSYAGYYDHSNQTLNNYPVLKSYAEKMAKNKSKASPRKSQGEKGSTKAVPPLLKFTGTTRVYAVKRELGAGAFAPVYLVESYDPRENAIVDGDGEEDKENVTPTSPTNGTARQQLEALKTESPPGTLVWEFHILRLLRQRLGPASRTMQSVIMAHECHLYRDEAYIVLSYSPQGTLLDLVNLARSESVRCGKPAEGLDETLAIWFSVELLRTLEDMHRVGILHGDLKGDNCLVRFESDVEVSGPFDPEGKHGWSAKGLKVIDFGRGIDVRMFKPAAQFIADWPSCAQDCAEIRECRPWKWQIDYHGAAGVIHSLLFGKYIETVPAVNGALGPGQKKEWKLKESLKRYWEKEIWADVFAVLLNPGCVADREEMPIQGNLRRVRMRMEKWLVEEGERGGRDLRASLRKMERLVGGVNK